MAEYDDDFDFEDGGDLIKQLRKQVKELSNALKERDEVLDQYYTTTRENQIGEVLSEMGLNAKIALFVPDDVEDEDDLKEWLNEYGEVFGATAIEGSGVTNSGEPTTVEAAERMSAVEAGGIDPDVGHSLEQRIKNASTPEELEAILKG